MKQVIHNLIAILIICAIIIPNSLTTIDYARGQLAQSTVYNNPLMGIRFNYPANWNFSVYYGFEEVFCKGASVNCELVFNPNYEFDSYPNIVAFVISAITRSHI